MRIRTKIILTFVATLVLITITTALSYRAAARVGHYQALIGISEQRLVAATGLRAAVRDRITDIYEMLLDTSSPTNKTILAKKKIVDEKIVRLQDLTSLDVANAADFHRQIGRKHFAELDDVNSAYHLLDEELDRVINLKSVKPQVARESLVSARRDIFQRFFLPAITSVIENETDDAKIMGSLLQTTLNNVTNWFFALAVLSVVAASLATIYFSRSIVRRLVVLGSATQRVATGDFSPLAPEEGVDEISTLVYAFNWMVTSLKSSDAQLAKQHEILMTSSKMSALGEMAGGIAHEINNPLALIQMRAGQLNELADSNELDLPTIRQFSKEIENTTLRISKIVKGLKTFVRDESRDPFVAVPMQSVIKDTLEFCKDRAKTDGVRLDVIMPELIIKVECRPTQISQVIINLVNNALDAIQALNEKWVSVSLLDKSDRLHIAVTDSGRGIPKEIRDKLMQPFFTTKEVGKGTGLGLSISRGLVAAHRGSLFLDPESANTCFVIDLPKIQREFGTKA